MPPSGSNSKKESGRAKKKQNEAKMAEASAAEKERQEAASWEDKGVKGGKAKKVAAEVKRKVDIARKAEIAKLLAEEESLIQAEKAKSTGPKKKAIKPAEPGAMSADEGLGSLDESKSMENQSQEVESYTASGIDNALDLLEVVTAKMDKASVGAQASKIEQHPERRFKAALEAYQERELPNAKKDNPGLRLQQYRELLYKQFQKSPENPFNQTTVAHDASKEEKIEALNRKKADIENRLREK